jgi:TonB family protein
MRDQVRIAGRRGHAAAAIVAAVIAGIGLPSASHSQDSPDVPPDVPSPLPPPLFDSKSPPASVGVYGKRIFEIISQNKSYLQDQRLRDACKRGGHGVTIVAFSVDRNGHLLKNNIFKSSGSATLDEAALDIVRRSQPFPSLPSDYAEPQAELKLPFNFVSPAPLGAWAKHAGAP